MLGSRERKRLSINLVHYSYKRRINKSLNYSSYQMDLCMCSLLSIIRYFNAILILGNLQILAHKTPSKQISSFLSLKDHLHSFFPISSPKENMDSYNFVLGNTKLPPKASPMHCNPMHTPNKGTVGPRSSTVCNDIPESCGVPKIFKWSIIIV